MAIGKVLITIKRPEGHTEEVDVSKKFAGMNDVLFANLKKATAEAGRGECLSYKVVAPEISAEDLAEIQAHDKKAKWFEKHGFSASDVH